MSYIYNYTSSPIPVHADGKNHVLGIDNTIDNRIQVNSFSKFYFGYSNKVYVFTGASKFGSTSSMLNIFDTYSPSTLNGSVVYPTLKISMSDSTVYYADTGDTSYTTSEITDWFKVDDKTLVNQFQEAVTSISMFKWLVFIILHIITFAIGFAVGFFFCKKRCNKQ